MDYTAIKRTFDHYDKDHNGKISREEFMAIYSKHTPDGGKSTVDYLLKTYDVNKDGHINFDEFVLLMTGGKGLPGHTNAATPQQPRPQAQNFAQNPSAPLQQYHVGQTHTYKPASAPLQMVSVANGNGAKVIDPVKEHLPSTQHAFKLCPMGKPLHEVHLDKQQVYIPKGAAPNPQKVGGSGGHSHGQSRPHGGHATQDSDGDDDIIYRKQVAKGAIEGLVGVAHAIRQGASAQHKTGGLVGSQSGLGGKPPGKNPYL